MAISCGCNMVGCDNMVVALLLVKNAGSCYSSWMHIQVVSIAKWGLDVMTIRMMFSMVFQHGNRK